MLKMAKLSSVLKVSNRTSNSKGKTISVYLRREDLELLDLIGEAYNMNRSETIQFMLKQVRDLIAVLIQKPPDFVKPFLEDAIKEYLSKQLQTKTET
jgi:hypothetical protein